MIRGRPLSDLVGWQLHDGDSQSRPHADIASAKTLFLPSLWHRFVRVPAQCNAFLFDKNEAGVVGLVLERKKKPGGCLRSSHEPLRTPDKLVRAA